MRSSSAASRSSSSRSTSSRANGSNSRSASGRPCHRPSAARNDSAAAAGSPGCERLAPVVDELLEVLEVELARLDAQQVTGRPRGEARLVVRRRGEHLAQPRDVVAQRVVGGVDALLREQLGDQPVARDDAVRAQQQQREQRALLRPAERKRRAVYPNRERAEDPELEAARSPSRSESPSIACRFQGLGTAWDSFGTPP